MSPAEPRPQDRPAWGRSTTPEPETLPLRLSVARGGLGIELTEPVAVGGLLVEELEVGLTGLNFPLDLSGGVKQFRNRRGVLRRAAVRLDLHTLGTGWQKAANEVLPAPAEGTRAVALTKQNEQPAEESKAEPSHDRDDVVAVAVSVFGEASALAFDLVLTSGTRPRWIIDRPRGIGLSGGPLRSALQFVDRGLDLVRGPSGAEAAAGAGSGWVGFDGLSRRGRAVEMSNFAQAISFHVLPLLGCRVPQVPAGLSYHAEFLQGEIRIVVDAEEVPSQSGSRAVRLGGLADFAERADDAWADGRGDEAREAYLMALEKAPGHPEILLALAELDAVTKERNESALAFIDERGKGRQTVEALLLQAEVLDAGHRRQAALDCLRDAYAAEEESVLAALLALQLAGRLPDEQSRQHHLQAAVSRAPYLTAPRWQRFQSELAAGRPRRAAADVEHLEGLSQSGREKARTASRAARLFADFGYPDEAKTWLLRALKYQPDDLHCQLDLADALGALGEATRAAELYQSVLRVVTRKLDEGITELPAERLDQARLALAAIVATELNDESLALAYLEEIASRSSVGLQARMKQREIFDRRGDTSSRERVEARTLEAIELGWIPPSDVEAVLKRIAERNRAADGSADLVEFAERLQGR